MEKTVEDLEIMIRAKDHLIKLCHDEIGRKHERMLKLKAIAENELDNISALETMPPQNAGVSKVLAEITAALADAPDA